MVDDDGQEPQPVRFDLAKGISGSGHFEEMLSRTRAATQAFADAAAARPDLDSVDITPTSESVLLRRLLDVQLEQVDALQELAQSAVRGEQTAAARDDRGHRLQRASLVAALEAALLTVALGTGQHEDVPPLVLVGTGVAVVAVVAAAWVDWRSVWRRLHHAERC